MITLKSKNLDVQYDERADDLIVEGCSFKGDFFRVLKNLKAEYDQGKKQVCYSYRIEHMNNGAVQIVKVPDSKKITPAKEKKDAKKGGKTATSKQAKSEDGE